MSVLVVDQSVENKHTSDLFSELFTQRIVKINGFFERNMWNHTPDRNVRNINATEKFALRSKDTFPVFKVIIHSINAHLLCDLCRIILAIRLIAAVSDDIITAFVKINAVVFNESPSLWERTARCEFG